MRFCKSKWVYSCQIKQLSIIELIELVSHGNRTDWIENGRSNCEREREMNVFGKSELCTSAYWYVHYCEYLKRFLRLSALENCILANQLCAIKLRKQHSPPLSPSHSVCVSFALPLQNSSCAYLSKHFRRENRKKCTYKAKAKENCCMRLEAQQMCKVFLARWRNITVESAGKYGTRKTAAAAAASS